jgi:hypothetical protein
MERLLLGLVNALIVVMLLAVILMLGLAVHFAYTESWGCS